MAQITSGLRAILSHPIMYDFFQNIMGAHTYRDDFVKNYVRPNESMKLLDIGCGTGMLLKYLPRDVTYVGYDPCEKYIRYAQKYFGKRGEFKIGFFDATEALMHQGADIAVAFGVLHHLCDKESDELFKLLKLVLSSNGRFISIDPTFVPDQNPLARFIISKDRGRNVRSSQGYADLAKKHFTNVSTVVKHRTFIPYSHCIMECQG